MQQEKDEWLPLKEAAETVGISLHVVKRLVNEGRLQDKENILDKRERLVNVTQLKRIVEGT